MKCKTPTEVLLVDLLEAILADLPGYTCDDFHHAKKDRHAIHEQCPVEKRFMSAIDIARRVLSDTPTASPQSQG
jgi:hypothetical protein